MAAPTTEEFSFGNESTVQLANQYDMGQSWTLSFGFTISPANQTKDLTILSTAPTMGRGVKLIADIADTGHKFPTLYAPNVERSHNVTEWVQGGNLTCTMTYDSGNDTLTIKYGTDSWNKGFSYNGVDYSSKVLSMFTTNLSDPSLGSGWGISGGTFTGEAIAPNPNAPAVPEPTTATLSLLALAGLAARRRRK